MWKVGTVTVLEKLVQGLMLKFKYIVNGKKGFYSALNYRAFLMFSIGKHLIVMTQRCWTLVEALCSLLKLQQCHNLGLS